MQTAINLAMEQIDALVDTGLLRATTIQTFADCKRILINLLPTERSHIEAAFDAGIMNETKTASDYYQTTYNKEK